MTMTRSETIVQIMSNYLETGVIENYEIDRTMKQLVQYSDNELILCLTESHRVNEMHRAIKSFRCLN